MYAGIGRDDEPTTAAVSVPAPGAHSAEETVSAEGATGKEAGAAEDGASREAGGSAAGKE